MYNSSHIKGEKMEQQKQKEVREFYFSMGERKVNEFFYLLGLKGSASLSELEKPMSGPSHYVLTPQGWKEFTEDAKQGAYPNGYPSDAKPNDKVKPFFVTNDPITVHRMGGLKDRFMYFNGIETIELTKKQFIDMERDFIAKHQDIEK